MPEEAKLLVPVLAQASLPEHLAAPLLEFLALLRQWNKAFNLVGPGELDRLVSRHICDSLQLIPLLEGDRCMDLGSGAGFPGIPLAIAQPQRQFLLLDSNGRKTRFLRQVGTELGMMNVQVVDARLGEQRRNTETSDELAGQDSICSRAVADPEKLCALAAPLLNEQGCVLAMVSERQCTPSWQSMIVHRYQLPGEDEARAVLKIPASVADEFV